MGISGFIALLIAAMLGQTAQNTDLALVGGTVYVSAAEDPIRDGVVLIHQGKIAEVGSRTKVNIPKTAQVLDCAGRTVTAGFWNSHVHFTERKWAEAGTIPVAE